MNRGRSSDSLDNGLNDIISSGSSSPTNFSSDDEIGNLSYSCVMDPMSSKSRLSDHHHQSNRKVEKYSSNVFSERLRQAVQTATGLRSISGSRNKHSGHVDDESELASTSHYNKRDPSGNIDLIPSRIPAVVPESGSISLLTEDIYDREYDEHMMYNPVGLTSSRQPPLASSSALANIIGYDHIGGRHDVLDPVMNQVAKTMSLPPEPSQDVSALTARMCAKLVECRTMSSAIEFVEFNRDLIDNLTRIITREAPAFRNYDMSNYQIDYSVKESFNPSFWQDREPVITTADGNCQYHAVSISLTGSEMYTQEVRLATAVAVVDNRDWFDLMLELIDRGTVLDLVHTIAKSYSWGDETTLKAIAVAIKRRIFLYTCNIGKKDYEMVKSLSKEELLDAFKEKKYRGGTGIHTYADPLTHVPASNYIMLFHKSEHFIAVLPTSQQPTMFEPYNPIVPTFS